MSDGEKFVWAKVYCDLPRDLKLLVRSTADRYLFVVLILLAKESATPGVIDAEHSRAGWLAQYCGMGLKAVRDALMYFEDKDMIATSPDGSIRLLNFAKRQEPTDRTVGERVRRWRYKHRNSNGPDSRYTGVTDNGSNAVEEQRTEDRGQINAVDWELGSVNTHPLNPPRPETAASPAALCVSGFDEWWTEFAALTKGHPGDKADAGRRWNTEVPPGSEAAVLVALQAYAKSDQVQRGVLMKGPKFLGEWRQWLPQEPAKPTGPHEEVRYGPKGEAITVMVR